MNAILEEIAARLFVAILCKDSEWVRKFYNLFHQMVMEGKANRFAIRTHKLLSEAVKGTEEFLEVKIEKDVDDAIDTYLSTQEYVMVPKPVFSEKPSDGSQAQNDLGGEIRSTHTFYDKNDEL